jgi:4-amino-4-deoxy-L-arabinose transferase-like glycosyltransferase
MAELVEPAERTGARSGSHWTRDGSGLRLPVAWARQAVDLRGWTAIQRFVLVLTIVYLAKQVVYVLLFPAFSGHDEVAHYAYLRVVATERRVPIVPDLDEWRVDFAAGTASFDRLPPELYKYCQYVTDDWWRHGCGVQRWLADPPYAITYLDEYFPSGWIYSANHPPLYYILMTPVYWLSEGASPEFQLYVLRFAAIPFGLATVLLAFLTARTLFPLDGFVPVVSTAFVAFQTQISYEAAMLNNDILGIALYSLALYLLVRGVRDRFPLPLCFILGIALGLSLLAKSTSLTVVLIAGLTMLVALGVRDWRGLIIRGVVVGAPMLVLIAPWYVFLYRTYGNFTVLPQIEALQWWNNPAGGFFDLLLDRDFAEMRFKETWGYWGWRLIPLDKTTLWAIGLPLIVALGGLVQYALTAVRRRDISEGDPVARPVRWQVLALGMLVASCVVAYLAIIQFGVTFSLTQARYFFPIVNAAAILLALGWRTLIPLRFHPYGQGAAVAAMVAMNIVIFSQFVIPYWHLSFD